MNYDELAVKLLENMKALFRAKTHQRINDAMCGEAFGLQYIALNGGSVLPGDISAEMNVSSARVAAALNNLENKGLITRRTDKNDRRKVIVEITPEGREIAEKQWKNIVDGATKLLNLLGENDAREYVRIMGRMTEVMPELWKSWSL
ncbi:MAG: MarR family transcriptional regulator [Oscillospiraceae bacterium]|jgi:DNA-binding MarR family transcriptional regulator|nr:MarR family transcriptional regulator [Oscillospiraceae bacterium]